MRHFIGPLSHQLLIQVYSQVDSLYDTPELSQKKKHGLSHVKRRKNATFSHEGRNVMLCKRIMFILNRFS